MPPSREPSLQDAVQFIERSSFVWHQRFELVPGVETPGAHDLKTLFQVASLAGDLSGKTALDVGTSNGGAAFLLERLGADRVVAVDIYPPEWFGFHELREFLGSHVEYVQGTTYDLSRALGRETFDMVLFWGVLYHLRHPLLALDEVRTVVSPLGEVSIETAVCDGDLPLAANLSLARFHRRGELAGDPSNWFVPTVACLEAWCASSGLDPTSVEVFGEGAGMRCVLAAERGDDPPEYARISYEVPLRAEPSASPDQ